MFDASIVLQDAWRMVGNWTERLGFRNAWEAWAYQAFHGLLVCPLVQLATP